MKIHVFQHVPFETPAMIGDWAKARGHSIVKTTRFYRDSHKLPELSTYDALVIMGGPMGVDDHYSCSWLMDELTHIEKAIKSGKYVFGVCLGAQLIAKALGADVRPNRTKEIGWFSVTKTQRGERSELLKGLRKTHMVLHWHGDRFEIPHGARHLMSSKGCDNQAFSYDSRVLGLQYHLEMDEEAIDRIIRHCGDELIPSLYVQTAQKIKKGTGTYKTRDMLYRLLDNWAEQAAGIQGGKQAPS